ncbi:hypothetical protein K505DRAFT_252205, partial [Melanomma pulvis-pyrius CBS 109.77]
MALPGATIKSIVVNIILLFVSSTTVALRFAARRKVASPIKWDDWTILFALICMVGGCMSAVWASSTGVQGVLWEEYTYDTWVKYRKVILVNIIISHFVYGVVKISVLLFYRRIFTTSRGFNIFWYALQVANAIFIISDFFVSKAVLFSTNPVSDSWTTPPETYGTHFVINFSAMLTSMSVIDIVLDLGILVLPIPMIWKLHLPQGKRLSIAAIFMSGGFCLVASIFRLYYIQLLVNLSLHMPPRGWSRTPPPSPHDLWGHIEAFASII